MRFGPLVVDPGEVNASARVNYSASEEWDNASISAAAIVFRDGEVADWVVASQVRSDYVEYSASVGDLVVASARRVLRMPGFLQVNVTLSDLGQESVRGSTTEILLLTTGSIGTSTHEVLSSFGQSFQASVWSGAQAETIYFPLGTPDHATSLYVRPLFVEAQSGVLHARSLVAPCGVTGFVLGPGGTAAGLARLSYTNDRGDSDHLTVARAGPAGVWSSTTGGILLGPQVLFLDSPAEHWKFEAEAQLLAGGPSFMMAVVAGTSHEAIERDLAGRATNPAASASPDSECRMLYS